MNENQSLALFKCLSDRSRLRILANLSREPMYVELLAQRLSLSPSTVSFHLKKMEEVGLVTSRKEQYYAIFTLCPELIAQPLSALLPQMEAIVPAQEAREAAYRQKVLDAFFEYGKLKAIPVQQKKARIILEELLKSFQTGRTYTEKEVNLILADFYDDFCTLRRDMIGEGLMARERNVYWVVTDSQVDKPGL